MSLPKTYKRAVFPEMGKPLVVEDAPLNLPGKGEVLVKIEACGVCHTDMYAQYNGLGGGFPLVPGHEIIGNVAAVGDGVTGFSVGDRVGAGYHGGHDGSCDSCKEGWPSLCDKYRNNSLFLKLDLIIMATIVHRRLVFIRRGELFILIVYTNQSLGRAWILLGLVIDDIRAHRDSCWLKLYQRH